MQCRLLIIALTALLFTFQGAREASAQSPQVWTPLYVVPGADAHEFIAFSPRNGQLQRYRFPKTIQPKLIDTGECAVFDLSGGEITELVAVDQHGRFVKHGIKPTEGRPLFKAIRTMAVVVVNGEIHAFSARTGTWATLRSDGDPVLRESAIMVRTEKEVAFYSEITGRWAIAPLSGKP